MDNSDLDERYFIDQHVYNCAFCKIRNVKYTIPKALSFNWSPKKICYVYLVQCSSCECVSMHLSFTNLAYFNGNGYTINSKFRDIDSKIIYSRPTSFFTLDESIPPTIRELIAEAEAALQFNLLTGSSASLRKAIYTLVKKEDTIVVNQVTGWTDYTASIKSLKEKFTFISEDLIDTLAEVQGLASNPIHEDAWETWDSKHLRFLIELTKSILNEMYAIPEKKKKAKAKLVALKTDLDPVKK